MKVSKKIINSLAVGDMVEWVCSFKIKRDLAKEAGQDAQEFYNEKIKKLQEKILKEL